jgi:hypothetical protein
MACNWVRFAYRFLPLTAWRAFLLARHIDNCPSCQGIALGDAAIRSLGMTPAGLENEPPLSPFAAGSGAPSRGAAFPFRWRYAYGVFLALVAVGGWIVVSRLVPRGPQATGRVFVSEVGDEPASFAVLDASVGDRPAQPVIFKTGQPGMTIVWFEKASN